MIQESLYFQYLFLQQKQIYHWTKAESKRNRILIEIDDYKFDYDDEFNEFQSICDLFSFKTVTLTKNNMDSIKEIANDLKIDLIFIDIDNYIETTEKVSQSIDQQQTIIDSIDEIFDLLYNINRRQHS